MKDGKDLMARRIRSILLICNSYDSFSLEEDGRIDVQIAQEYNYLHLSNPPEIHKVETTAGALDLLADALGLFPVVKGIPLDADLVFDVRCFVNPFYVDELKDKTGNDQEVRDYVMGTKTSKKFMDKLISMIKFLLPLYMEEGKTSLTIGIGCTGGKHRSVTMANVLSEELEGYSINLIHRDILRGK